MKDLRRLKEAGQVPEVVFVFRDSVQRGEKFFAEEWPSVRAIADENGDWWKAFAIGHGSPWKLFGPGVFGAAWRAFRKGHFIGLMGARPTLEPGMFVLSERGGILKQHSFDHIGDHPDFAAFAKVS